MPRNPLFLLMFLATACASSGVPGGLKGLKDGDFENATRMVVMSNTVQAKTLLAAMPPQLKTDARWHYLKARNLLNQGDSRAAIPHLKTAIQRAGRVPALLNDLAAALILAGRAMEAVHILENLKIKPFQREVENNLAVALLMSGRTGEAINRLRLLVDERPRDPMGWYNLGMAMDKAGNLDKAISSLKQATVFAPDNRDILVGLAMVCERAGDQTCSDMNYNRATALYPTDWQIRVDYGVFLARRGFSDRARSQFIEASRLNPNCAACMFDLGLLEDRLGHRNQAKNYYNRFLQLAPDDPAAASVRKAIIGP
jgi:Flp pilus assembly protein TadD